MVRIYGAAPDMDSGCGLGAPVLSSRELDSLKLYVMMLKLELHLPPLRYAMTVFLSFGRHAQPAIADAQY